MIDRRKSEILWHYTSLDTLYKIWDSKSLLASDIRDLNDRKEWKVAFEAFRSWSQKSNNPAALKLLDDNPEFENTAGNQSNRSMVVSFSARRDNLSMWRVYGNIQNGGKAEAIGFEKKDLISICKAQTIGEPGKCVYEMEIAHGLLEDQLGKQTENFETAAYFAVWQLAHWLKDKGFSDEAEWRIPVPVEYDGHRKNVGIIGNRFRYPIDLQGAEIHELGIAEIMGGPTTSKELLAAFVENAYGKRDFPKTETSSIPFV